MPKPKKTEGQHAPGNQENLLPDFPITWTSIGIYLEAHEENLNCENLVELVNKITQPRVNVAVIELLELIDQELSRNSDLGLRLKSAKQELYEKNKKEVNLEHWMPPSLLLVECLKVRAVADRDIEHKKEAIKRIKTVEEAKSALQTAKEELENARRELLAVETSLQSCKNACKKAQDEAALPLAAKDTIQQTVPMKNVGQEERKGGRSKSHKEKASKENHTDISSADAIEKLEPLLVQAQNSCNQAEEKVSAAEAVVKTMEASRTEPYELMQVYILAGLGNDPTSLMGELAGGSVSECRLCAILRVKMARKEEGEVIKCSSIGEEEERGWTSVATKIKALARSCALDDPVRQIAVMDVPYEVTDDVVPTDILPPAGESEATTKKKKTGGANANALKRAASPPPLPYDNIAKAVASCLVALVAKLRVYERVKDAVQPIKLPAALPSQDLDVKYYNELLQRVPENLVSIPIILHCIVEQAILHSFCCSKSEFTYLQEENKKVGEYLSEKFLKLGSLLNMTNEGVGDEKSRSTSQLLSIDQWMESTRSCSKDFGCIDGQRIIHESDLVEKVAWRVEAMQLQNEVLDVRKVTSHFEDLIWVPGMHNFY